MDNVQSLWDANRILYIAYANCMSGPQKALEIVGHAQRYIQKQLDEKAAPIFAE